MTAKAFDPVKFAAGVRELVAREVSAALEEREAKSLADHFRGPWLPGQYKRGDLVQCAGSVWIAVEDATGKPGGCSSWRLLVRGSRE
ncbi:hypothetical protein [Reyranella sp.]|uniref:hypothetical protein n=1 Tax=Reyranella sp. TaxID=1929291 RepID=UPI003D0B3674